MRDVAERVGITERAVQHIVRDLAEAGVLERTRDGRRNRYTLHPELPLRHPIEAHRRVADSGRVGRRAWKARTAPARAGADPRVRRRFTRVAHDRGAARADTG
jgi:DNA-binding transcriptional regulator PaaX